MDNPANNNGDNGNTPANNNGGQDSNTPANNGGTAQVTMSQEDLNNLINGKFAKGAEKATNELLKDLGVDSTEALKGIIDAKKEQDDKNKTELEKVNEQLEALREQNNQLEQEKNKANAQATVNAMAVKHSVKDVEYFAYELRKVQGGEDFKEEEFISNLKKNKPYVFGQSTGTPNTDNSSNNGGQPNTLKDKVKGMSIKELRAMQKNL